jgi:hypothetical protein
MNYERFKKRIVSLALMCVFAFSMLVANAVPADAQGYQMRYVYSYPYSYYPYSYQQYGYQPYGYYPSGYYQYGYYPTRSYPYGYYPYERDYWRGHRHHHWYHGRHHIRRAIDWLF